MHVEFPFVLQVGEEKRETKLRFLQEMEGFFMNGINVDESWRILCLGSLSFVRAVLEGRFFEGFTVGCFCLQACSMHKGSCNELTVEIKLY